MECPIILALTFLSFLLQAQNQPTEEGYYTIVEEMPRFPFCENVKGDIKEKKTCSDKKLKEYISENTRHDTNKCKEGCIKGMAVVSFIIEKDGTLKQPKLLRNPGGGWGKEAMRLVELLSKFEWTPGKQNGVPVSVRLNLPIRFKIL